jgi:methyl coenzyme M reductase beta subunit
MGDNLYTCSVLALDPKTGDQVALSVLAEQSIRLGHRGKQAPGRSLNRDVVEQLESIATLPRGLTKVSLTVPVRVPLLAAPEEFLHQLFALLGVAIPPRDCASG